MLIKRKNILDFDIDEKIKEQQFKDSHNGFSEEDYLKSSIYYSEENPLQAEYDNWLNKNKDCISWFSEPKFVFTNVHRRIIFALLNVCLIIFCVCIYALPTALIASIIFAIPMNLIAAFMLFNVNDYDIKQCTHGCSNLYSKLIGKQGNRGTGHIVVKCEKCGTYRVGTEYIGYD